MNEELVKNLVTLIDDTLGELDELKKSDSRFDAQKIELGEKDGLMGRDKNGSLGKEDAEKADEEDDDEEDDDDKKDKDEAEKGEGTNSQADPNRGHHKVVSKEDTEKAEGKNREADPNGGNHKPVYKGDDMGYSEGTIKKSIDESNTLMKSYIDEQMKTVTDKLEKFGEILKDIADAPVARRGASYKDITPLKKNNEAGSETLSKSEVASKLFELKKSGEVKVDTVDIVSVETGTPADLARIVNKYEIK